MLLLNSIYCQVIIPGTYQDDYFRMVSTFSKNDNRPISIYPSILSNHHLDSLKYDIHSLLIQENPEKKSRFDLTDPILQTSYNTKYPSGFNDGPIWSGKGLNTALSLGFTGKTGILRYSLNPILLFSQNQPFKNVDGPYNKGPFQYPFENNIDWVLRYGNSSMFKMFPGQSEIRLVKNNFTIGLSTQNQKWGPSRINPIIMSNNAEGFPHLDIGTARPAKSKIGFIDFKSYWGLLNESKYFDNINNNNVRYITGMSIGYRPIFLKALSIGINRILYTNINFLDSPFSDAFAQFSAIFKEGDAKTFNGITTNDYFDQVASVFMRWTFIEEGFDVYIEYARNDFAGGFGDFITQPDHSRGFTAGFTKLIQFSPNKIMNISYEHTSLDTYKNTIVRATPTFYVHGIVKQGYTNNGQIIGASAGPGANTDFIDLTLTTSNAIFSFNYYRLRYNDDYFYSIIQQNSTSPQEIEHQLILRATKKLPSMIIDFGMQIAFRKDWQYLEDNVVNFRPSMNFIYLLK